MLYNEYSLWTGISKTKEVDFLLFNEEEWEFYASLFELMDKLMFQPKLFYLFFNLGDFFKVSFE